MRGGLIRKSKAMAMVVAALATALAGCGHGNGKEHAVSAVQFDVSDGESAPSDFAWSPDGSRVAVLSRLLRKASVFDVASGQLVASKTDLVGGASSIGWDAAGNVVLAPFEQPGDAAAVWDLASDTFRSLPGAGGASAGIAGNMLYEFSIDRATNRLLGVYQVPQGKGARMELALYDLSNGQLLRQGGPPAMNVAIAPGGQLAAFTGQGGELEVFNFETGQTIRKIKTNRNRVVKVAWSPDGQVIATGAMPKGFGIDPDTGKRGPLVDTDLVQTWSMQDSARTGVAPSVTDGVRSLDFSPDGSLLAVSDGSGTVHVLEARNLSKVVGRIETPRKQTVIVRFSPDGARIGRLLTGEGVLAIDTIAALEPA
jgi:WD40 repeat protein